MKDKYDGLVGRLVWDGTDEVRIPPELGTPNPGQMVGTAIERLGELAGRTCYDSLGAEKSRSSADYHPHIRQVTHTSVYGHGAFTVEIPTGHILSTNPVAVLALFKSLVNRPGMWFNMSRPDVLRVTTNLRSTTEWAKWTARNGRYYDSMTQQANEVMGVVFHRIGKKLAPQVVVDQQDTGLQYWGIRDNCRVVEPEDDSERWVALYIEGSRGLSHEQVRHGWQTGISQRCISGDSSVTFVNGRDAKHPFYRTVKWLYDRINDPRIGKNVRGLRPRVLDEATGLFSSGKMLDVVHSGKKPCFKVTLMNGREIVCTKDHRIYTNSGWKTLDEIAGPELVQSVVKWNKNADIKIATNGVVVVGNGLYKDKEWLTQRYIVEGASTLMIAAETGVKPGAVRTNLSRLGLKKREMGDFAGSPVQDREWLHEQYRVLGMGHAEIAANAGCSTAAVHNYCRKFGIQKTRSEINLAREPWNKGATYSHTKPYSPESIEKYRQSKTGAKNPRWKGGRGSEARRAFQAWKKHNGKRVFERDGWTCRLCDRRASEVEFNSRHMKKRRIEIHHIMPLWNRPDLACEIDNMVTVCWPCQSSKLNGHEMDYAPALLEKIKSPVAYAPSDKTRILSKRKLIPHFVKIESITFAGEIDTYDLVLEGPNHGFVANGVVVHNSTRYVSEDESPWVMHPLIQEFLIDETRDPEERSRVKDVIAEAEAAGRRAYGTLVKILRPFAKSRIESDPYAASTAHKQARGASRGYLGNALKTAMIFSGAVDELKWILKQRASNAADGEIRCEWSMEVLPVLKACRYGPSFAEFEVEPAVDGVGYALKGGGNK